MYNLLPIVIILVCLIIMIAIIVRKFPQLAILDVENMPSEKAEKVKEQIIKNRLQRDFNKWNSWLKWVSKFWSQKFNFLFSWLTKLKNLRTKYQQEKKMARVTKEEKIILLLGQAKELIKNEEIEALNEAEKKLIEVVSLDQKCLPAFNELGEVYFKLKKYLEAKQTFSYSLKLLEFKDDKKQEAEVNYQLSLVNLELENLDEALNNIIESLRIEPNNPRYLDTMLDLCLLKKDRALAWETLERLKEVNPENNKLAIWEEQINNL